MSDSDRVTFEEACRELGLSESELEQKVAAGEIASIKEGDSLYFKRDVIEKYKEQSGTEPTVLVSDDEISLLEDDEDLGDIDFGIEIEEPAKETAEGGKQPAVSAKGEPESGGLASGETVLDLDGILEEDSEATTPVSSEGGLLEEEPALGGGEDTLLDTDILDLGEGEDTDTFELDTAEDTLLEPTEEGTLLRGGGARVMQMKRKKTHAAWTVILVATGLLLLLPFGVLLCQAYWETVDPQEALYGPAYVEIPMSAGATAEQIEAVLAKVGALKDVSARIQRYEGGRVSILATGAVGSLSVRELGGLDGVERNKIRREDAQTYRWIEEYNVFRAPVESLADLFR